MRPTRRAYVVLAVVAGGVAAGSLFGVRSLDAIVVPALVALVAAALQVWRAPEPELDRTLPPARTAGTPGTVELRLRAAQSYPATVRDRLPPGIDFSTTPDHNTASAGETTDGRADAAAATEAVIDTTTDGDAAYEITPRRRGEHEIGPTTVAVTDVLGLLTRKFRLDDRGTLLVFPSVRRLAPGVRTDLIAASAAVDSGSGRRDAFDGLREYVPGDPLRDVHWKSSAKRGDLLVREFTGEPERDRVAVAAGLEAGARGGRDGGVDGHDVEADNNDAGATDSDSEKGHSGGRGDGSDGGPDHHDRSTVDAMADAAATVCLSVLDDGVPISLSTPSGTVTASPGAPRPVLEHLATVDGGSPPAVEADIVVTAADGDASVRFGGVVHSFEELVAEGDAPVRTGADRRDDGRGGAEIGPSDFPESRARGGSDAETEAPPAGGGDDG